MALNYDLLDTHASRMLKAIESVLEGKANKDAQSVEINGKKIVYFQPKELIDLRKNYLTEYRKDLQAEGLAPKSHKIKTRFV